MLTGFCHTALSTTSLTLDLIKINQTYFDSTNELFCSSPLRIPWLTLPHHTSPQLIPLPFLTLTGHLAAEGWIQTNSDFLSTINYSDSPHIILTQLSWPLLSFTHSTSSYITLTHLTTQFFTLTHLTWPLLTFTHHTSLNLTLTQCTSP